MEENYTMICTRCGSHHVTIKDENYCVCQNCEAIIARKKATNFKEEFEKLQKEGKSLDILNLRKLTKKALKGHIDTSVVKTCSQEILKYLPDDILGTFYLLYVNRKSNPFAYESFLEHLNNEATITEMDEIVDIIVSSTQKREEEKIRKLTNHFYGAKYNKDIDKALIKRQEEIELFSDIRRDIFICHSSTDINKVNEILKKLEEDGNTCWISSRNIPWDSDNYWLNIEKAIKSCDIFLCINSINTMQSNDCRREVEIARNLNKKRIEYKLDDAKDITLFKKFFTGQWITNTNDLLEKVYDLKNKEDKLLNKIKDLIDNNKLDEAKASLEELNTITSNENTLTICKSLIKAINLINEKMYNEAKEVLLDSVDINYTKSLLKLCNKYIDNKKTNEKDNDSKENKVEKLEKNDKKTNPLSRIKILVNIKKNYKLAEEEILTALEEDYDNYDLWYYYLKAITENFKTNMHSEISIAFENLYRLANENNEKELKELENKLYAEDLDSINDKKTEDEDVKHNIEEEKAKELEEKIRRELEEKIKREFEEKQKTELEERRKQELKEKKKKDQEEKKKLEIQKRIDEFVPGNIIEMGTYPQTIKAPKIKINEEKKDENGYYTGSDGKKYAFVKTPRNYYRFSNGEEIKAFRSYYFKVEPIKWKVLEVQGDLAFLFSESILDHHNFDSLSNDYDKSSIRKWLNNEFFLKAFSEEEKRIIQTTNVDNSYTSVNDIYNPHVCSNTKDKIFLLSAKEITNQAYGYSTSINGDYARRKKNSDYAKANYAYEDKDNGYGCYWLRSACSSNKAARIFSYGNYEHFYASSDCIGIAPCMWVKFK